MKGARRPNPDPGPRPVTLTPGTVKHLEGEVERLLLITEALWTILRDRFGMEDQELLREIVRIDMRDGRLDGRLPSTPPQPCPKCNRTLSGRSIRCLYCGEPLMANPFAR